MALTTIGSAALPVGSVIQTKSVSLDAAVAKTSDQTNTFVDVGLTLAITPEFASSKILLTVHANVASSIGTSHYRILRDSTAINIGDAAGNRLRSSAAIRDTATPYDNGIETISMNHLDSPSTTSEVTYKLQGTLGSTYDGTFYLNRTHADNNADYGARCTSNMTLQEIKQ